MARRHPQDLIRTNRDVGLNRIRAMDLLYFQKRWIPGKVPRRSRVTQFETFRNATLEIPPLNGNYEFPSSIYNMSMHPDMDETNKNFQQYTELVKRYTFNFPKIESLFTSHVLSFDLEIFEDAEKHEMGRPKPLKRERKKSARLNIASNLNNQIESLYGNKASMREYSFETFAYKNFRNKNNIRPWLSLRIKGEPAPINILLGKDDIIGNATDNRPSTVRHEITLDEIRRHLDGMGYKANRISNELKSNEYRDPILYYWSNGIIQAGFVYWLIEENNTFILHDLTSSFNMKPYDKSSEKVDVEEKHNFNNALGLLYYKTSSYRYLHEERTLLYEEIIELSLRAIEFLNKEKYPMIIVLSNFICSNTFLPPNSTISDPDIKYKNESNDEFRSVDLSKRSALEKMEFVVRESLYHLCSCIELLGDHLTTERNVAPPGPIVGSIDPLLANLENFKVKDFAEKDYGEILSGVLSKSVYVRLMIYCLRKQFLDCLVQATLYHRFEDYPQSVMFNVSAMSSWITMASFWSEDELPLPFQPMFLLGDALCRFSYDGDYLISSLNTLLVQPHRLEEALQEYRIFDTRFWIYFESNEGSNESNEERIRRNEASNERMMKAPIPVLNYCVQSFECFARCLLYTNDIPNIELLKRLCVVANNLAFCYLHGFYARSDFKRCGLLINLVENIVRQRPELSQEMKIIFPVNLNKSRYLRKSINYSIENETGPSLEQLEREYEMILEKLQNAMDFGNSVKNLKKKKLLTDITIKQLMGFRFEYIWWLKGIEFKDSVTLHGLILKQFEDFIKFCNESNSEDHSIYFRMTRSILCACVGEYLFALVKDNYRNNHRCEELVEETEFWFEQATKRFEILDRNLESVKVLADRFRFYYLVTHGFRRLLMFDEKAFQLLGKCDNLLKYENNQALLERPDGTSTEKAFRLYRFRMKTNGVLDALIGAIDHTKLRCWYLIDHCKLADGFPEKIVKIINNAKIIQKMC